MTKPRSRPKRSRPAQYRIPTVWNCWNARNGVLGAVQKEIIVDPPTYLTECLGWIKSHTHTHGRISGKSLSQIQSVRSAGRLRVRADGEARRAGDWIRRGCMYGMMIRCSTAWDHDGDGRLTSRRVSELGTFLKSILLLPHLLRMGVNVLYLLPVVHASRLHRKGELGCPYAAKNFLELDPDQYDHAFGDHFGDVNDQFRLFVDSAHRLGMRVMIDIAPRTAARDNDWILDHPEWFYWIERRFERGYRMPQVLGATYLNPIPGRLQEIYDVPAVREHLAKFRHAPNASAPAKWRKFTATMRRRQPANLLAEIAREFGVTTPPGSSDVVNDSQPSWSDVTYLRLFEDHPTAAAKHLLDPAKQPPYVLYDTAKASMFPGRRPQRKLWDALADILPFYQRFGVDGARVDMAHALPPPLEKMILEKPRRRDPDFCLLAEQLGTDRHAEAFSGGYNIIIGPSWWRQPRGHEGQMHKLLHELPRLKVPVMAAAETPDTPRAVVRRGKRRFAMQAVVVNCFLPNAVPMINSGMEILERQPMNLGLDATPSDRYALAKSDPLRGKLAFFDRYALHWDNHGSSRMIDLIGKAMTLRNDYLPVLANPSAYFAPRITHNAKRTLATGFRLPRERGTLLMLANLDYDQVLRTRLRAFSGSKRHMDKLLSLSGKTSERIQSGWLSVIMKPGDIVVLLFT